jgi:murein DD-endopeptidase MepM/ murein hydrolase activator NlpD
LTARVQPMRALKDGRCPRVTSGFRNKDRPNHQGADLMYEYRDSDPAVRVGDAGAVVKGGIRRWWVPFGTEALAIEAGEVIRVGKIDSGWRVWIFHPASGISTGYFHLRSLSSAASRIGLAVDCGAALGLVGDNPKAHDATHLHLEAMTGRRFASVLPRIDPVPLFIGATVLPALTP